MTAASNEIFDRAIVWDMVWPLEPWCGNGWDKLELFRAAGHTHLSITVAGDNNNIDQTFRRLSQARSHVQAHRDTLILVDTVDDVIAAKASGKLAVSFHFEGSRCFERELSTVEAFYRLGVRFALLAFNQTNSAGGGCAEESDGGLTRFGRRLIGEMQRVGMLVDLSHTGRRTSLEAIESSTRPMVFSHSNVDCIAPHFRNLTDEQIQSCAAVGGVIGISGSSAYLGDPMCETATIFKHVDYIAEKVGIDHVGLGLDSVFEFGPINAYILERPDEWPDATRDDWPGLRYAQPGQIRELGLMMLDHGYDQTDMAKVLGGNFMRVCGDVWGDHAAVRL